MKPKQQKEIITEGSVFVIATNAKFLSLIADQSNCKACGRRVWWVKMRSGKLNPITDELISHFADCPRAEELRK